MLSRSICYLQHARISVWSDIIARAITTKAVVDRLPDFLLIANTPAEFAIFLRKDAELAARVIAQSGAEAD